MTEKIEPMSFGIAEECRAVAEITTDPLLKAEYLKLASEYLELAAREENLRRMRPDAHQPRTSHD